MFSLCVTLMFSVRSEIVITGIGMNSLCNFTKYISCEIFLNVNFKYICVVKSERISIVLITCNILCLNDFYVKIHLRMLNKIACMWTVADCEILSILIKIIVLN